MAWNLICYDLINADSYDYNKLYEELENFPSYRIQESVWLTNYNGVCLDLAKRIGPFLHNDDRLFIKSFVNNGFFYHNLLKMGITIQEIIPSSRVLNGSDIKWGTKLTRKNTS